MIKSNQKTLFNEGHIFASCVLYHTAKELQELSGQKAQNQQQCFLYFYCSGALLCQHRKQKTS